MPLSLPDRVRTRLEIYQQARDAYFDETQEYTQLIRLRAEYLQAAERLAQALEIHDQMEPEPERAYPLTEAPSSLLDDDDHPRLFGGGGFVRGEGGKVYAAGDDQPIPFVLADPEHREGC